MNVRIVVALFAFLAGFGAAPPASARLLSIQFYGQPDDDEAVPPPPGAERQDWEDAQPPRPARVCQKMCADDYSPCDPIYFKTEDGRCDGVHFR